MSTTYESIHITCGSCNKHNAQKVVSEYVHTINRVDEICGEEHYSLEEWILRLSFCLSCDALNLTTQDDDCGEFYVLYPKGLANLEGLPPNIEKAYKAACAVRHIDANAFAVLTGRVLELVCLDQQAPGKSLYDQLEYLSLQGLIPGPLATMASQLRTLRNIGAHASLGELSKSETPILKDLCESILEYVYSAPYRVEKVKKRIDALKNSNKNAGNS